VPPPPPPVEAEPVGPAGSVEEPQAASLPSPADRSKFGLARARLIARDRPPGDAGTTVPGKGLGKQAAEPTASFSAPAQAPDDIASNNEDKLVSSKRYPFNLASARIVDQAGSEGEAASTAAERTGEASSTEGALLEAVGPVRELEVDEYGQLKAREVVGDGLAHHEIPSNAAIRKAAETRTGTRLSAAERRSLQRANTAVAIPAELHAQQPTTGGRNKDSQIVSDSADLSGAARRDLRALIRIGLEHGYTRQDLARVARQVRKMNHRRGIR
jgi:hypothetical protein